MRKRKVYACAILSSHSTLEKKTTDLKMLKWESRKWCVMLELPRSVTNSTGYLAIKYYYFSLWNKTSFPHSIGRHLYQQTSQSGDISTYISTSPSQMAYVKREMAAVLASCNFVRDEFIVRAVPHIRYVHTHATFLHVHLFISIKSN